MAKSAVARLDDIAEAIGGIQALLSGIDFATYAATWHLRRATERGIEIISEASRHLPQAWKERHPEVEWHLIAGIGNVLRHEYHHVDDRILWDAVQNRLPGLQRAVEALRRAEGAA